MEACLAPEAIIWHSRDNLYQSREDNVRGNQAFMEHAEKVRYNDRRVNVFEGGFVQQHTFCLTNKSGFTGEMKVCFIAYVRDGMISRIYEYYDYGQVGKLTGQS